MNGIDTLGQVISTDVLVVGGGISGLVAGIKARENAGQVLIVEKGGIGWSGQALIAGGGAMIVLPEHIDRWFKWAVEETGCYLNNQDLTYQFAQESFPSVLETAKWGFPWVKNPAGEVALLPRGFGDRVRFGPAKALIKLKQAAAKRGVKMMDKVFMVDLLKQGNRVTGAIGFGLVDGKTYIFKAKATIIACGGTMQKAHKHFVVNTGEGAAMAYRAGAQLRNAEFAGSYGFGFAAGEIRRSSMLVFRFYENRLGEKFMAKYYPELFQTNGIGKPPQDFSKVADAMAKEVEAGRGPIYVDFSKLTPHEVDIALGEEPLPAGMEPLGRASLLKLIRDKTGLDGYKEKLEVVPQPYFLGGPINVDVNCQSTLEGLWAIGDASWEGSSWYGATAMGALRGGISYAIVSGLRAGVSAAGYSTGAREAQPAQAEVAKLKERMLAPLNRKGGTSPHEVIYQIQEAIVPMKYVLRREAGRLKEALSKVEAARGNAGKTGAGNPHELSFCHQAESMALNAGWVFKASLMREESRGTFWRDDFPGADNKNWLKWIVIQKDGSKDRFSTQPLPLDKYRMKP